MTDAEMKAIVNAALDGAYATARDTAGQFLSVHAARVVIEQAAPIIAAAVEAKALAAAGEWLKAKAATFGGGTPSTTALTMRQIVHDLADEMLAAIRTGAAS